MFCLQANEIAFINTLSEQNKKMDIMTKHQDVKARLMDMQEERQRKIGEKAAKEAAVEVKNNVTVLFWYDDSLISNKCVAKNPLFFLSSGFKAYAIVSVQWTNFSDLSK